MNIYLFVNIGNKSVSKMKQQDMSSTDDFDGDNQSITTATSIESADVRQLTNPYSDPMELMRKFRSYEIDHVGNGSFQISQVNLLAKRSIEPIRSVDAQLSARGLHHRSVDVFVREANNASNVIKGMMRGEKVRNGHYKPSAQLFQPHFTRALANERLEKIDAAISDYSMCLKINPQSAVCYFNRAGLFRLKKQYPKAIQDMHKAVKLEPTNMDYRQYRALICREGGDYEQAMQDTIVCKAVSRRPELKRLIDKSGDTAVTQIISQHDAMMTSIARASVALSDDPIVAALQTDGADRTDAQLTLIKDFLKTVKLFASLATQATVLTQIAAAVQLTTYEKHGVIFSEGDPGHHFFIILDGEVAITKTKILVEASSNANNNSNSNSNEHAALLPEEMKKEEEAITETVVLVKLFRGHSFGETALESKGGLRTAGAVATQPVRLLSLHVDAYHSILHRFRAALKEEVRAMIATNAIFNSWEESKIEHLASLVVIKQFAANAEIMSAQKPVPALMLVKSGIVTLLKAVPRRLLHASGVATPPVPTSSSSSSSRHAKTHSKDSRDKQNRHTQSLLSSSSSVLFSGETPGLWIVNKGWTTHLDEQAMREHTQFVLDQRSRQHVSQQSVSQQSVSQSVSQHQQQSDDTATHNNRSSGVPAAVCHSNSNVPINSATGLPLLDAAELDLVELAVGILGSGQVFGELAVLDPTQTSPVSAIASTAVELYCFESDVLAALGARFYGGTMRALLESIALHDPPLDKIGFFFRQKFTWEQHKLSLMQRLQRGQRHSRVTSGKSLVASVSLPAIGGKSVLDVSQVSSTDNGVSLPLVVNKEC